MTSRAWARAALRTMALPVPDRDRTLHVQLPPGVQTPDVRTHCTCHVVAQYVWRAAPEQRCTRVRIHNGPAHAHECDPGELFKRATLQRLGFWPRVQTIRGRTPPQLATVGHRALGNTLEERRPIFHVPAAVSGSQAGGGEEATTAKSQTEP